MPKIDYTIVAVLGWSRSGSFFFANLFDNHPKVLMIHYMSFFDLFAREALWQDTYDTKDAFVDALLDLKVMGYHVGEPRRFDRFDPKSLKPYLLTLSKDYNLHDKRECFMAIHHAYALMHDQDLSQKTHIVFHLHNWIKDIAAPFMEVFPDAHVIGTQRDPIKAGASSMRLYPFDLEHYHEGFRPQPYYNYNHALEFTTTGAYRFLYSCMIAGYLSSVQSKRMIALHMEALSNDTLQIMQKICTAIGLAFDEVLLTSTVWGEQFWGDIYQLDFFDGFKKPKTNDGLVHVFFSPTDLRINRHIIGGIHDQYAPWFDPSFHDTCKTLIALPTKMETRALEQTHTPEEMQNVLDLIEERIAYTRQWIALIEERKASLLLGNDKA